MRRPRLVHAAGRARRPRAGRDPARLPDDQAPRAVRGVPDAPTRSSLTPRPHEVVPVQPRIVAQRRDRPRPAARRAGLRGIRRRPMSLTVAVTGPTGEIGKPFIRALERAQGRQRGSSGWRAGRSTPRRTAGARPSTARATCSTARPSTRSSPRPTSSCTSRSSSSRAREESHSINLEGSRNVFEAASRRRRQAARLRVARSPPTASTRTTRSRSPRTSRPRGTEAHPYSRRRRPRSRTLLGEVARGLATPTPTSSAPASSRARTRRC